ncbi:MAG: ABC transporter permease subunit [Pseudarthrobacter sp.]
MAVTLPAGPRTPWTPPRGDGSALRASRNPSRAGRTLLTMALAAWFLLPLAPLGLWLFADRWSYPAAMPDVWGFDGVRSALAQGAVPAFARSLGLGLAVSAVATPLGTLAARALAYHRVPFPAAVNAVLFAPLALPAFAAAFGLNVLLLRLQIPPLAGVILILSVYALPYTTYTMRVAYGAHDRGFEDEARTLGATRWQVLTRVHLPLLAPALARSAFLAFLVGWSDYLITLLVGGGAFTTVPLLVASAASGTGNDSVVAVLSTAAVLPPLIVLLGLGFFARKPPGDLP